MNTKVHRRRQGSTDRLNPPALHTQPEGHFDGRTRGEQLRLRSELNGPGEDSDPAVGPVLTKRTRALPEEQLQSI
jgi:hypothetical protein